jgi:chemotaxis protein CheC
MQLSERQRDALVEIVNIAFGRAAASLSNLTGERILVSTPDVSLHAVDELPGVFSGLLGGSIATVHQIFKGTVAGSALLMLDYQGAVNLARLLRDDRVADYDKLDPSDCEVLTEVGNILLNACLGTFGNVLHVHISFSVPNMHIESVPALLHSLSIDQKELKYAIIALTNFQLKNSEVGGYLTIVLGVNSLENLVEALEILG